MYGSKEWKITRSEERTLDAFQHKCLRRILGTRWQLRVTNEEVTARASMDHTADCVTAVCWTPEGKRPRRRPKVTWKRTVEPGRNRARWRTWNEAKLLARHREVWKDSVVALCASWRRQIR